MLTCHCTQTTSYLPKKKTVAGTHEIQNAPLLKKVKRRGMLNRLQGTVVILATPDAFVCSPVWDWSHTRALEPRPHQRMKWQLYSYRCDKCAMPSRWHDDKNTLSPDRVTGKLPYTIRSKSPRYKRRKPRPEGGLSVYVGRVIWPLSQYRKHLILQIVGCLQKGRKRDAIEISIRGPLGVNYYRTRRMRSRREEMDHPISHVPTVRSVQKLRRVRRKKKSNAFLSDFFFRRRWC